MKTDIKTFEELQRLSREYADELERSDIGVLSKKAYIYNTLIFIRWIEGGYAPREKKGKS